MTSGRITPAALFAAASGQLDNFLAASTPGGIEAQEARGQAEQVRTQRLPKDFNGQTRGQFEKAGFVFGKDVDDLFVSVAYPPGWTGKATEHSMWSKIVDEQGRERVSVLYKAAFYDRSAHAGLCKRFGYTSDHSNVDQASRAPYEEKYAKIAHVVTDCGEEVGPRFEGLKSDEEAKAWLDSHYPDWRDPLAYWEAAHVG